MHACVQLYKRLVHVTHNAQQQWRCNSANLFSNSGDDMASRALVGDLLFVRTYRGSGQGSSKRCCSTRLRGWCMVHAEATAGMFNSRVVIGPHFCEAAGGRRPDDQTNYSSSHRVHALADINRMRRNALLRREQDIRISTHAHEQVQQQRRCWRLTASVLVSNE